MVHLNQNFDAESVEPRSSFDPLPAGRYAVQIIESEMKDTKNGQGQYLQLTLEVLEGEFAARRVWDRLNLINPNATAVDIAQRTLSQICRACGVMNVDDSEQLHFKPMVAKLKLRPEKDGYEASNDVSAYESYDGNAKGGAPERVKPTVAQGTQPPLAGGLVPDDVPF